MRKFGLVGNPLGHSFSKTYFANKFRNDVLSDCRYDNFEMYDIISLKDLIDSDSEIVGLNITIPYKSEVLSILDSVDELALEIGAVNVIKITDRGGKRLLKGFNTDIYGFEQSLTPHLVGRKIDNALIIGTGGSSKAVAFVLGRLGIRITSLSRSSKEGSVTYRELSDETLRNSRLIINTTPVGMFPLINRKPELNYSCIGPDHILYDLIYNPLRTSFLQKGEEQGCTVINGLEMLHIQAEKSWEIWNNPDV
jgi:shikimate dehydrogenase